ncbi:hypothetical protein [Hydrogenophaga sp. 5NK40-0174]|uniref:hypothetical protein n=1 Tax=Hydrogenophaga sp. 5NK40-0174 TaxID=3127649 RepID=UPI003105BF90
MKSTNLKMFEGKLTKVRLERKYPSGIYSNGFVHFVGNESIILQQYHDFYCEGYCVLRVEDIIGLRSSEYERFFEKMFKDEDLLSKVSAPSIPPVDSLMDLLEYFKDNETNIVVECEFEGEEEDVFSCGKVSGIENEIIWIKEFNALGEWEDEEVGVELESVTKLQFDTPYINVFAKHLPDIKKST